ncbi:MAG: SMI1/KNR4 family protein [Gammaproteobacteria bacterium]|nr:SMI1/KNR4 family protein [Gammaproteobacteria bacterium]
MMKEYTKFLKEVESMNKKYASIYFYCELEPLTMPFWSWQEIQKGLELRQEWEVDESLIPFYGDWHDLFCLDENTGEIVALNEEREVLCIWASIKDYLNCLSEKEILYDDEYMASGSHDFGDAKGHEITH